MWHGIHTGTHIACLLYTLTQCHFLGAVPASVGFTEGSLGPMLISGAQALGSGLDPSAKNASSIPHLWSPYSLSPSRATELWVAAYMATAVPAGETRQVPSPLPGALPRATTVMG